MEAQIVDRLVDHGVDVGEDGRTHQCIDYVGILRNLFGMRIVVPADANQTDRALRFILENPGMFFLAMGRSKLPVISDEDGKPFFGDDYRFEIGRGDWLRNGSEGAVVVNGVPVTTTRYDGMIHGFFGMGVLVQGARDAVSEAVAALRQALDPD